MECGAKPNPPPGGRIRVKSHGLEYGLVDRFDTFTPVSGSTTCGNVGIKHGQWTDIPGTQPLMQSTSSLQVQTTQNFDEVAMLLYFSQPIDPSNVVIKASDDPVVKYYAEKVSISERHSISIFFPVDSPNFCNR